MSLGTDEKITLCNLHLTKGHECLRDADIAIANQSLSMAANRLYYACFNAVHALFVMQGIFSKTHEGMNVLFNLHYVKTGIFDAQFGTFLNHLENLRQKADYNVIYDVSQEDINKMKPLACDFVKKIEEYLSPTLAINKNQSMRTK